MGHAHWLVLRKPLIPSSTACHPLPPLLAFLYFTLARLAVLWAPMYGRANHRKVMMQEAELGCLSNFRLSNTCHPPVVEISYLSVTLYTIAMVKTFRGPF